ncbi:ParB N-terminal domain-containing protein [bacterium]|nr:ParB N-terminal domain-containing protein [bacterium]
MKYEHELRALKITEINLADQRFNFNYQPNLETLKNSIRNIGMLQPLLVYESENKESLILVDGWRRLNVLQELKIKEFMCIIIKNCDFPDLLSIYFNINTNNRQYNIIELNIIIKKLKTDFALGNNDIITNYFNYVNINKSSELFSQIERLNGLIDPMKPIILNNGINLANAVAISSLAQADQEAILTLLSTLKLNANKLKIMLLNLDEISKRDNITIAEIVESIGLKGILKEPDLTENQKIERILNSIDSLRYPEYTELKGKLKSLNKALSIPPGMKFETPEFFEGDKFKIEFGFKDKKDLKESVEKLKEMLNKEELDRILDMF